MYLKSQALPAEKNTPLYRNIGKDGKVSGFQGHKMLLLGDRKLLFFPLQAYIVISPRMYNTINIFKNTKAVSNVQLCILYWPLYKNLHVTIITSVSQMVNMLTLNRELHSHFLIW